MYYNNDDINIQKNLATNINDKNNNNSNNSRRQFCQWSHDIPFFQSARLCLSPARTLFLTGPLVLCSTYRLIIIRDTLVNISLLSRIYFVSKVW